MNAKFAVILLGLTTLVLRPAFAADSSHDDGKDYGSSGEANVTDSAQNADPWQAVPGYEGYDVEEQEYFHDQNYGELENQAMQNVDSTEAGEFAWDQAHSPPPPISGSNPVLQYADGVQSNVTAVAGSIEGTYSQCESEETSTPQDYELETCTQWKVPEEQTCDRIRVVKVTTERVTKTITATLNAGGEQGYLLSAYSAWNLQTGALLGRTANQRCGRDDGPGGGPIYNCDPAWAFGSLSGTVGFPADGKCNTVSVTTQCTVHEGGSCVVSTPSCSNNWYGRIDVSGSEHNRISATAKWTIKYDKPKVTDSWNDQCAGM